MCSSSMQRTRHPWGGIQMVDKFCSPKGSCLFALTVALTLGLFACGGGGGGGGTSPPSSGGAGSGGVGGGEKGGGHYFPKPPNRGRGGRWGARGATNPPRPRGEWVVTK